MNSQNNQYDINYYKIYYNEGIKLSTANISTNEIKYYRKEFDFEKEEWKKLIKQLNDKFKK